MKTTTTPSGTGRARLGLIVSMTVFGTIGLFVRRIEILGRARALPRGARGRVSAAVFSRHAQAAAPERNQKVALAAAGLWRGHGHQLDAAVRGV